MKCGICVFSGNLYWQWEMWEIHAKFILNLVDKTLARRFLRRTLSLSICPFFVFIDALKLVIFPLFQFIASKMLLLIEQA